MCPARQSQPWCAFAHIMSMRAEFFTIRSVPADTSTRTQALLEDRTIEFRKALHSVVFALAASGLAVCGGSSDDEPATGTLSMGLTDAAADKVSEVRLTISATRSSPPMAALCGWTTGRSPGERQHLHQ